MPWSSASTIGKRVVPSLTGAGGVWRLGEVEEARRDELWPTSGDPFFGDVALLLQDSEVDNSWAGQTVTASGSATTTGAQIKYGTSSFLTNGPNNRYSVASAASLAMPADFTIECWVFFDSFSSNELFRVFRTNSTGTQKPQFSILNDTLYFDVFGTQLARSGTQNIAAGTWYHFAASRKGSSLRLFLDGVQVASGSTAIAFVSDDYLLPHSFTTARNLYFDDFRLTVNACRYESNFTPPAGPHPAY